jgi:hypothetical protein
LTVSLSASAKVEQLLRRLAANPASGGTHGYAPSHPELLASFFMVGPGVLQSSARTRARTRKNAPHFDFQRLILE